MNKVKDIFVYLIIFVIFLLCCSAIYDAYKNKKTEQKIEDKIISAKAAETIANGSNSQYLNKKTENSQKEKEVSENAFNEAETRNNNSDNIVADFAELCSRAREYNQLRRAGSGSQD